MQKESFILYNSFYEPIKALKNEQLGKLLRAIFNYTINGEITQDNEILVAFMFIKNQIDIDTNKWQEEKTKRSEAGKKGMASRWNNNDNNVIIKDNKNNNVINAITNITDNVNDNVYVNDNDNVINKKENIIKEKTKETQTITQKEPKPKANNISYFLFLISNNNYKYIKDNNSIFNIIKEWLEYKQERKELYKETGLKNLLTQIENNIDQYGEKKVIDVISQSMANNWKGIIFEKLQKENKTSIQPKWINEEIKEDKATEEEIKKFEEELNRIGSD